MICIAWPHTDIGLHKRKLYLVGQCERQLRMHSLDISVSYSIFLATFMSRNGSIEANELS